MNISWTWTYGLHILSFLTWTPVLHINIFWTWTHGLHISLDLNPWPPYLHILTFNLWSLYIISWTWTYGLCIYISSTWTHGLPVVHIFTTLEYIDYCLHFNISRTIEPMVCPWFTYLQLLDIKTMVDIFTSLRIESILPVHLHLCISL